MGVERNSQQMLRQYEKYLEDMAADCGDDCDPLTFHKWYERDYESTYDERNYD